MLHVGYKIVGYRNGRAYSLYDPNFTINTTIGSTISNSKGIYLGTTEKFVRDYYSGGTDDQDMLMQYQYDDADLISGEINTVNGGEVVVKKARLIKTELLPKDESYSFKRFFNSASRRV